jgi:glucan phosphorylase
MKSSVATLCPTFNMQRVVKEYASDCYVVSHERYATLTADDSQRARGPGYLERAHLKGMGRRYA